MGVAASMVAKVASMGSDWLMAALHRAWSPGSLQDVFRACITDNPARWFHRDRCDDRELRARI